MSEHYKGKLPHNLEPHHVAEHLPYNIATAVVYLMRAPYKHDDPVEDMCKAVDHIQFEIHRVRKEQDDALLYSSQRGSGREDSDSGHTYPYRDKEAKEEGVEEVSSGTSRTNRCP